MFVCNNFPLKSSKFPVLSDVSLGVSWLVKPNNPPSMEKKNTKTEDWIDHLGNKRITSDQFFMGYHHLIDIIMLLLSPQIESSLKRARLIEEVQKYKNLPTNWASSNVPVVETDEVITPETIDHAEAFIKELTDKEIKNIEIYPRGYDGISFVWEKEDKYLEVTITNEECLSYFLEEDGEFLLSDDNGGLETFKKFPRLKELLRKMS